jgi:acyl carrier protein
MKQAVAGEVRPIPVSAFRSGRAEHAFRFMAEGRHTGKIVIRGNMEIGLRSDRTYLIAGGVGGLGLKLAQWMADRGARNIVLVSRGAPRNEALQEIRAIRGTGALVLTRNADIADWDQATGVFDEIRASMPPLAGVVQAAGVLRRAVVEQLDWATFWTVLRPKALGTRNLDRLTRDSPLDFFVAFSSFASWIGAPGQANHAAASCCVDAIVHRRRMLGLPGVTINWGPWAQVGAASLGDDLLPGGTPLIPKVALSAFERALETTEPQVSILDADWAQVVRRFPATVSFLSEVLGSNEGAVPVPFSVLSSDILAAMQPESRRAAIRAQVADVARCVLGLPEDAPLSFKRPLSDMGMDSLMSIEFRDRMERALDLKLESTVLYSYPSLEELLRFLEPNWRGLLPLETNAPSPSRLDGLLHAVEVMSDKRAVSILKQRAGSV